MEWQILVIFSSLFPSLLDDDVVLRTEGELGDVLRAAVLVHHHDVVLPGETELGGHETQHVARSRYTCLKDTCKE